MDIEKLAIDAGVLYVDEKDTHYISDNNAIEALYKFAQLVLKDAERKANMKKFSVLITTSFDGYVTIEASDAEEAKAKAMDMVESGEFNALDFEPFTEIPFAEEIK